MEDQNNSYNNDLADTSAFKSAQGESDLAGNIMAIGVGGGGNNAVNHMYVQGIKNVSFVNINTDRQTLCHSLVPHTLEIGDGLGAGNKPEKARDFAEESADEIAALFDDKTKMVFITAGMGGGTGTGAAPVVARIAKERGLLTIGIVTIPFLFEGKRKITQAIAGADEMAKHVDALLVINNERLSEIYGDLDFLNAFGKADDTLSIAARSISELITCNGLINLDFNDVDTTLRDGGAAIISTGYGEGEGRVTQSIREALKSPLLKNRDINGSKRLLFNLYFNPKAEQPFLMSETDEITEFIRSLNKEVEVIWGVSFDESLGNGVKMTILASGFDVVLREEEEEIMSGKVPPRGGTFSPGSFGTRFDMTSAQAHSSTAAPAQPKPSAPAKPAEPEVSDDRLAEEYGLKIKDLTEGKDRSSTIVLGVNQLDDDAICDILEKYPTYKRDRKIVDSVRNGAIDGTSGLAPDQTSGNAPQTFSFG